MYMYIRITPSIHIDYVDNVDQHKHFYFSYAQVLYSFPCIPISTVLTCTLYVQSFTSAMLSILGQLYVAIPLVIVDW